MFEAVRSGDRAMGVIGSFGLDEVLKRTELYVPYGPSTEELH